MTNLLCLWVGKMYKRRQVESAIVNDTSTYPHFDDFADIGMMDIKTFCER
jgi:hypothetical protein